MAPETTPLKIALWGVAGAGKTALLSALYHDVVDPRLKVFSTEASQAFLDLRSRDRAENRFPPPTAFGVLERVFFQIHLGAVVADLHIHDRAGQRWADRDADARQELGEADGVLLLIDPSEQGQAEAFLTQTLGQLFATRGIRDERPFAVCLSKADTLIRSAEDYHLAIHRPADFARRVLRASVEDVIGRFCVRYALFAVSSVGVRLLHGVVEPMAFRDEVLEWRLGQGGSPVNLAEPFVWLLEELGRGR